MVVAGSLFAQSACDTRLLDGRMVWFATKWTEPDAARDTEHTTCLGRDLGPELVPWALLKRLMTLIRYRLASRWRAVVGSLKARSQSWVFADITRRALETVASGGRSTFMQCQQGQADR